MAHHKERTDVNWYAVKEAYCEGIEAVNSIAKRYGLTPQGVTKRAKREKWERNVTGKTPKKGHQRILDNYDFAQLEADFKAGSKSVASLASEYGMTQAAIYKAAQTHGWIRGDLAGQIRRASEEKLAKSAVHPETPLVGFEKAVVEANAEAQTEIRRGHRNIIAKHMDILRNLADELAVYSTLDGQNLLDKLMEIVTADDQSRARTEAFTKALGLQGRIVSAERLANMAKTLIALEREAYGISKDVGDKGTTFEQALERILDDK